MGTSINNGQEAFSGDLEGPDIELLAGDTVVIPEPQDGYVEGAYPVERVPQKPADEEGGIYEATRFRRSRHHRTVGDRIVRGLVAPPDADISPYEA